MRRFVTLLLLSAALALPAQVSSPAAAPPASTSVLFGFSARSSDAERDWEQKFLAVPDRALAQEHLRILTQAPHIAGSPEDRTTAEYVAQKFRAAGLATQIREYKVWMDRPAEIAVDLVAPQGVVMHGPSRERVSRDPFQDDPRILPAFNAYSLSGDLEADVVYANYGRPEDIRRLKQRGISLKDKVLLVRYGQNFRGVKAEVAQDEGAAGVLIYSDPIDDGYFKGDVYPNGPWRPATGVQRGSIQYSFMYPGDPTTPNIASTPDLPASQRTAPERAADLPHIFCIPLSYADAAPILQHLGGPESPRDWQGALPFTYHVGPGPARVRMHIRQNAGWFTIWDVIGVARGSELPDELVIAGNHRDAWVYGAVDPNSGTAAMLEAAHGVGELLKTGWRPRRTIIFASWDAEEQGLIGSTEWVEQNEAMLSRAAFYLNMDTGVGGPNFRASAVGSLKQFIRDVTKDVASPKGGSVYDAWVAGQEAAENAPRAEVSAQRAGATPGLPNVSALGSGSDYSAFIDHLGVPAADVRSAGDYAGVYHSAFDDFAWYVRFADPHFDYSQQMARVFGLAVIRMAAADVLPYDYGNYGSEIASYLESAQKRAEALSEPADFAAALAAARRFAHAGAAAMQAQQSAAAAAKPDAQRLATLNSALLAAERALLVPEGLPRRPWFRHAIYAPGQYTGYEAVVIPGVNEAIDRNDVAAAQQQLAALAAALNRAAAVLEAAGKP